MRLLISMVAFSAILVLLTEILGAVMWINEFWFTTAWGALALVMAYIG